jgi:hypothetical protein
MYLKFKEKENYLIFKIELKSKIEIILVEFTLIRLNILSKLS